MKTMRLKIGDAVYQYQNSFPRDERPSLENIAKEAGINPTTLFNYIKGETQRPDLDLIGKLCVYIGIDNVGDIFEFVEIEES